jgi:hypothetical protein
MPAVVADAIGSWWDELVEPANADSESPLRQFA